MWKREWKYVSLQKSFKQALSFAILPSAWPDIRIVEPDQGLDYISSDQFEVELITAGRSASILSFSVLCSSGIESRIFLYTNAGLV